MHFTIITLFPGKFHSLLHSILKRSLDAGLWTFDIIDLHKILKDNHLHSIDNKVYGGGAGMLITPSIFDYIDKEIDISMYKHRWYMSPRGHPWSQVHVDNIGNHYQQGEKILILCGVYEGVDQRILEHYKFTEISIGDYILFSGELPAMVIMESLIRTIPSVINKESVNNESFSNYLLEEDQYTRPYHWRNNTVPLILTQGNHGAIEKWRHQNRVTNTINKRPDLYGKYLMNSYISMIINSFEKYYIP